MQNKPNVKDVQINVNSYMKSKYEILDNWLSGKNKPNSNPNKPNLRKAKMNVNLTLTKDYRKKDDFSVRINKPNLVRRRRIANSVFIEDYENEPSSGPKKQTQNKPKTNPILSAVGGFQNELKIACQKIRPNPWQTAFGGLSIVLKHKKSRPRSGGNSWSSCVSAVFFSHYRPLLPRDNCIHCMLSLALTIKELVCFSQAENERYDTPRNEYVL